MTEKIKSYFRTSLEEIKKVNWPTKKETYNYTLIVIFISVVIAIFLYILDQSFSFILKMFII
ncbi:preprotein translocase subunit SecE [bacterium]|nr:preprotein translocase subunit SecE [bacterium]